MPLTRLDNLISSKTGKYLYVSPDDFNATDALSNRGNSPVTPFKSIQRAFLEIARYSYLPGFDNDRFDQFSIMLMPGIHYIDNRPGVSDASQIAEFLFNQDTNQWTDDSILDIGNPDNVLYKFNNTEGGAIIPRGSSLVGYDLRRTVVRPLFVPDPASVTVPRSAIFNVTGGCYFWQFTIKDGQTTAESPLFNANSGTGEVYYDPNDFTKLAAPNYSHHKLTVFEYADTEELSLFYRKIAKAFKQYQPQIFEPGEFDFRVQENRIVGPLSDSRIIESLTLTDNSDGQRPDIPASTSEIEVTTKTDHGYFQGQFVAISGTEIDSVLEGIFQIKEIDQDDPRKFKYLVDEVVSAIGNGLSNGESVSQPTLGQNAQTLAEVDSVESASPYVFNCSIRSTWGICGIWANGLKATGFKSMVIAQYTGVSLQKDDRAFIRYDEYSNTWNQASLTDAFATVPYHTKGDSYWKDDWRNFHVRASEDAFIQNVSIFAVGFADHFLMESGGDMSITNSNSNFGNTSLHAIGFKGFAFNQDKGGYLTDIIPPRVVGTEPENIKKVQYYTVDIQGTRAGTDNFTKLYLGSNDIIEPIDRPAVTLDGFRLGAKTDEKLYVNLDPVGDTGTSEFTATLEPTGFVKYVAVPSILNPSGASVTIDQRAADAANMIEKNRTMIQEEVFGYILDLHPRLQNISYVNPGRDANANRYFDAYDLISANREYIVNEALSSTQLTFPSTFLDFNAIAEIVDAVAEDIRDGGNNNIVTTVRDFFDFNGAQTRFPTAVTREEANWAYNRARDLCKKAVANLLPNKADLYDPDPNSILFNGNTNKYPQFIAGKGQTGSQAEEAGDTTNGVTYDASNLIDPAGRYKDARNRIVANRSYIMDNALAEIAVYEDGLGVDGYFYFPGDPNETSRSRYKSAYRLIRRNKQYAIDTAIAAIQAQYPTFVFPGGTTDKCARDIGFFIDAIGLDIFLDGNEWSRTFVRKYFTDGGQPISDGLVGEVAQSIYGFNAARDVLMDAVSNQLNTQYTDPNVPQGESIYGDGNGDLSNTDAAACQDVQNAISTLTTIVTQVLNDGNLDSLEDVNNPNYVPPTTRGLEAGESKCRRDIGHLVDAIAQDLWFGGNEYTIAATRAYFDKNNNLIANGVDEEKEQSITAFKRVADACNQAINNLLYGQDRDITLDQTGDPVIVGDLFADAHDLVIRNKEWLAKEAYERMVLDFSNDGITWTPRAGTSEQDCLDDVYAVLEEIMWNVKFGGNHKAYDAAEVYVTNIFGGRNPKRYTPTTATYDAATGLSILTIPNHGMVANQYIKIATGGLTFTCALDNYQTATAYPRATDPAANTWLQIVAADTNTITVNVGASDPADVYEHQFVSAVEDCVTYGTLQTTFLDYERDAARKVFEFVKTVGIDVIRNQQVPPTGSNFDLVQFIDLTIVQDWESPTCQGAVDAFTTLMDMVIDAIGTSATGAGSLPVAARSVPEQPQSITGASGEVGYQLGNCSDVLQTIDTLVGIISDAIAGQGNSGFATLANLPPLTHGDWDCANVRGSIETLFDIASDAVIGSNLADLPAIEEGGFTNDPTASKCYRDVSYIVDAVVNDLRFGGNINSIQAGEAYYVGNTLDYIDGEAVETVDAWEYVRDMAIAAMRNFDVLIQGCDTEAGSAIVNVGDTKGLLIGMKVAEYDETGGRIPYVNGLLQSDAVLLDDNIPDETYIKRIVDNQNIELGFKGSKLNLGELRLASQTETTNLYFTFPEGTWADTLPNLSQVGARATNPEVIQDESYPECASIKATIDSLVGDIIDIIQSGPGTVTRVEPTADPGQFTKRATVFTINTDGLGSTNPHQLETGTPVRLVPRPRFDLTKREYVDVDKRLVRLPNGFDTNTTYYVIAPGRRTQPTNFGDTAGVFDSAAQTKLMLATSPENAAAGIYIYSSESDSIDKDVEIDLYQFVLDLKYDLHSYNCTLSSSVTNGIQTDVSHIFDVPFASVEPQRVFFRANPGSQLPSIAGAEGAGSTNQAEDSFITTTDNINSNFGRLNYNSEFYVRYENEKTVTIYISHSDAINENDPVRFVPGDYSFKMYANKRRSPVRFDPGFTNTVADTGKWFVNCKNEADTDNVPATTYEQNIIWRVNQQDLADRNRSTDMWFTRIEDKREADDRTYKLRYVIPKYLENARDPINGFVIKTRTDDTRKLVPQKVLLKPVAGNVYTADFRNPVQAAEKIGMDAAEFATAGLDEDLSYDPYRKDLTNDGIQYAKFAKFNSGIQATIQSASKVADPLDPFKQYLELTVFDHTINAVDFSGLKNETFTTVKINAPQGGDWIVNKTEQTEASRVYWGGYSSGLANIHQYFSIGGEHYLILKNVRGGKLEFSDYQNVQFTQDQGGGTVVFADMLADQDFGKSLPLKTLIRKNYPEYYYKQNGANVYTITPGDTIQDDAGNEYYVESVEDAGVIEDTFYVFSYETLQRRIAGQQDGIYYLSCLRGNISPFPTGAGVTENFKKFKFSQPVSSLYPLNYKNDPLWFQKAGTSSEEIAVVENLLDPPATYSAANNYIHGLVTTNDYKGSVTRELVEDLTSQPAFKDYDYTGENEIKAQVGNATSGSEDRTISISGDSTIVSDQRYYVELRRPSIARAGNHTFEYLGFGPGNYSTGLPARQEIVLTPTEDFYAQSKKQDGGIVFYTGLNSNGDLYIGNRKINAITGEETFLEAAVLNDSEDEDDDLGNLVTTFNTPVTFNQNITVVGGDGDLPNTFSSPIVISVQDNDLTEVRDCLIIRSNVTSIDPVTNEQQDESLDNDNFRPRTKGDIRISKNRVDAAVFGITGRRDGQDYMFQTHEYAGVPSNISPNNSSTVAEGGDRVYVNQFTDYNGVLAKPGDVLLKGLEVGKSGSLGWVFSNFFQDVNNANIATIEFDGTNVVKLTWYDSFLQQNIANRDLEGVGLDAAGQIKISNYWPNIDLNGIWTVYSPPGDEFDPDNNYVHFQAATPQDVSVKSWATQVVAQPPRPEGLAVPLIEISKSIWKEVGVLGAEALRTNTDSWGQFKVGINTVARSAHIASQNQFVSDETDPRANLDVVGTAFISGKTIENYLGETTIVKTETEQDNALLVGGDSTDPDDDAVLRVMTTNGGRVGINTKIEDTINPFKELNKTFVVIGDARIHENLEITGDLEVNGGDITTTNTDFALAPANAVRVNMFGVADRLNIAANTTLGQEINLGTTTTQQNLKIGTTATTTTLRVHSNSQNAVVDFATVQNINTAICRLNIGGGYNARSTTDSVTNIKTFFTDIRSKEVEFGSGEGEGTSESRIYTRTRSVRAFDGDLTNTVKLGTNATTFEMGSTGGTTTIRNTLNVLASAIVEGNIRLDGGLNAGIIEIERGRFNTTIVPHVVGSVENSNIDFYQYQDTGRYIDTPGQGPWGGTSYLVAGGAISTFDTIVNNGGDFRPPATYPFVPTTTDGVGAGATVTVLVRFDKTIEVNIESPGEGYAIGDQIIIQPEDLGGTETGSAGTAGTLTFTVAGVVDTGTLYYLPITQPAITDFSRGDLLFIDRANPLSPDEVGSGANLITGLRNQAESEIVRIEGIANVVNPEDTNGYRLIVSRGQEGTGIYNNHPDETYIAKFIKQSNASFITGSDLNSDGVLDEPLSGIGNGNADVRIGVAEFGGSLSTRDFLRLSQSEFVSVKELISTSPQSLIVNTGDPSGANDTFRVESTTGDTYIFGSIFAGAGFNRFTVDAATGDTTTTGKLTTNDTITLKGTTFAAQPSELFKVTEQGNTEFLTLTNGGNSEVTEAVTFQVDTATGSIYSTGSMQFFGVDNDGVANLSDPKLDFNGSNGNLTVYGALSALGTGISYFGGSLDINGGINLKYQEGAGRSQVDQEFSIKDIAGNEIFKVENNGSVMVAGQSNYFSNSGGRLWKYNADSVVTAEVNTNYFLNVGGNTIVKLPGNAQMGDMIRIIDIGGALTYNLSLVVRAATNQKVMNDGSNTGSTLLTGIAASSYASHNGGELVVQTPYAAFALVYAGSLVEGESGQSVPSSRTGWYLINV